MDRQLGHWGSRWKAIFVDEGCVCCCGGAVCWAGWFVAWDGCAVLVRSNVWDGCGGHFLGTTVDEGGYLGVEKPGECPRNPGWRVHVIWGRCGNRMK
eukprot:scaffold13744_cov73-Cylindrotheca_fusiformis.AAC.2